MKHLDKADLTIIIPVLNGMPHLSAHLTRLEPLSAGALEVIAIDSQSTDGSREYLAKILNRPNQRIIDHSPGLYESWNAAISQAKGRYLYIATIGDGFDNDEVFELLEAAFNLKADIVVSPPFFVNEDGRRLPRIWPIHRLLGGMKLADKPYLVPTVDVLLFNSIFLPGTLIGSSAANLYRTAFLQANLFPTDFRRIGDTAWAIAHSTDARWVVCPRLRSRFRRHGGNAENNRLPPHWLDRLNTLAQSAAEPLGLPGFDETYNKFKLAYANEIEIEKRRFERYDSRRCFKKGRPGYWWICVAAVLARRKTAALRRALFNRYVSSGVFSTKMSAEFRAEWQLPESFDLAMTMEA